MRCKLVGLQEANFKDKDTNAPVSMHRLFCVAEDYEEGNEMNGQRCSGVWTRLPLPDLRIGDILDLVYDIPLGSKSASLQRITRLCSSEGDVSEGQIEGQEAFFV